MGTQKYNYIDTITPLVPALYTEREDLHYGYEEELSYMALANFLKLVSTASSLFDTSNLSQDNLWKRFLPSNKLTRITPKVINDYVFAPLGRDISEFTASADFETFVQTSALSALVLNGEHGNNVKNQAYRLYASGDEQGIPGFSSLHVSANTLPQIHEELIDKLGLLYLFNSSGPAIASKKTIANGHVELSSLVSSLWVEKTFKGEDITEEDCLGKLFEYLFKNRENGYPELDASAWIPTAYVSSVSQVSGETYLSGTQLLDAYNKIMSVWLSPDMDKDTMVQDSFDVYVSSTLIPTKFSNSGSLQKFLKALGFASYDIHHVVDSLSDLIDIDNCPQEFLNYLATLIGWKTVGSNVEEWRQQLRNAVTAYTMKGTASGLDSVVEYLFDRDIFYPTSALTETWESYLPNMIYYVLKTESFLTSATPGEVRVWADKWSRNGDVTVNYDKDNMDNNLRFAVDMILERLDNEHQIIWNRGKPFRDSELWKSIISNPNSPDGFDHRGKLVTIPPWEKDRFYSDSYITLPALRSLSAILVQGVEAGGCGVPRREGKFIFDYCKTNLGLDQTPPMPGDRHRFKFLTSALSMPPNASGLPLRSGFLDNTNIYDYWNTKSSTMVLDINALDADFRQKTNSKLNLENLRMLHQVFRDFVPFRVMIHTVITNNLADGGGGPWGGGGRAPWENLCINGDYSKQDAATNILNDVVTVGFPGKQDGNVSAGVHQEGRFIPDSSATYWTTTGTVPGRFGNRSRSLRYNLPGRFFSRNGRNTPHSMDFYNDYRWGAGATGASSGNFGYNFSAFGGTGKAQAGQVSAGYYFVPKGWNFSSQSYHDVSSRHFDASNSIRAGRTGYSNPTTELDGIPVSSCFPFRAGVQIPVDCSTFGAEERFKVFEINRQLIDIILKLYAKDKDRAVLDFDHESMLNRKFGRGVHTLYREMVNRFDGTLDDDAYSLLYHAFGPFFRGGDMQDRGTITDGTFDQYQAHTPGVSPGADDTILDRPEYKNIIGGEKISSELLLNSSGIVELIESQGLVSRQGLHSWYNDADKYFNREHYSNQLLLSGVEIVAGKNSKGFIGLNDIYSRFRMTEDKNCVSIVTRGAARAYKDCLKLRFNITKHQQYVINGLFTETQHPNVVTAPFSEDIRGWYLSDATRDPVWCSATTVAGYASVMSHVKNQLSGTSHVNMFAKGPLPIFNDASQGNLRTATNSYHGTNPRTIRSGLQPGKDYRMEFEVSAQLDTGIIGFVLENSTKNQKWNSAEWGTSSLAGAHIRKGITEAEVPEVFTADFSVPNTFAPDDMYNLIITYAPGTATPVAATDCNILGVSFKQKPNNEVQQLREDTVYKLTVEAQARGHELGQLRNSHTCPTLGLRVCTDVRHPELNTGGFRYVYNFLEDRWDIMETVSYDRDLRIGFAGIQSDTYLNTEGGEFRYRDRSTPLQAPEYSGPYHRMVTDGKVRYMTGSTHNRNSNTSQRLLTPIADNHFHVEKTRDCMLVDVVPNTEVNQKIPLEFNTFNRRGPVGADGKRLRGVHRNIHTSSTGYFVEVFRIQDAIPTSKEKECRLDFFKIYGYDDKLNQLSNAENNTVDYDRDDVAAILRHFKDMMFKYKVNSRYYPDTADSFGTKGGSRSEMLIPYGGDNHKGNEAIDTFFQDKTGAHHSNANRTTIYEI